MEKQKTGLHQGLGIGSLVVGIIALLISFIPCLGQFAIFVAPVAMLMGLGGYYLAKSTEQSSGLNLGGIIISLIAFYVAWWQLSSLNDATNYMNKSMGNKGENSIGYLQIILTVVVIGIIIFINYTTGKKNSSQSSADCLEDSNLASGSTESISSVNNNATAPTSNNFDFQEFFQKNKKAIVASLIAIFVGVAVWFYFIKANPESDAKKAQAGICDCAQNHNDRLIKLEEKFLADFDTYKFKNSQEATDKLNELQVPIFNENTECSNQATAKYNELRNKYIINKPELEKFDLLFSASKEACNVKDLTKSADIYTLISTKIEALPHSGAKWQNDGDQEVSESEDPYKPKDGEEDTRVDASTLKVNTVHDGVDYSKQENRKEESNKNGLTFPKEFIGKWYGYGLLENLVLNIYPDLSCKLNNKGIVNSGKVTFEKLEESAKGYKNYWKNHGKPDAVILNKINIVFNEPNIKGAGGWHIIDGFTPLRIWGGENQYFEKVEK